jgi:DNA-binding winged helix-turn-helix (wHTH) protein/tetratricopeptide (TPR) repeat protein
MRSFGPFRLDVGDQSLWRGAARIALMPKPFAVLCHLVEHAGRLVTQEQLLGAIWPDTYVQPEVLRRYILEIRRALDDRADAPVFVKTFPKRGYQFIAPVMEDDAARVPVTLPPAGATPRIVGRGPALADLGRHLETALSGHRQITFIVGEPGIGKTSLADAFQQASAAIAGVSVIRGQSIEGFAGKEPYYPLLEAIGQLARGPAKALVVETLATHAPTWLVQFPALVRPDQHAALEREIRGATRERMVRELCEALEIITLTVPLVLVLEDLHWADCSTVDMISAIARRRQPARLLVLGTFRPADLILSESPLKALKQDLLLHRLSHEIDLERLEESDVAAYLAAEFGPGETVGRLATIIHKHSDGNPLFMTAMLDHLEREGVIVRRNGRLTVMVPLEQIDPGVPDTLRQMLEMQLAHLDAEEQQLLTCASVAGFVFNVWSVATMMDGWQSVMDGTFERLADRHHFLDPQGTRELPNGSSTPVYAFKHALYREILYRRLSPAHRLRFHRRLAEGLERLRAPADADLAAEIALHMEEAQEHERAIPYLLHSAQNATRRYAHRQALALLDRARGLCENVDGRTGCELELQILEGMGNAHYALGDMERSAETYASMATLAAQAGILRPHAESLMQLAHPAESIPYFLRAIELDPDFAAAYVNLSRIYSNLGEAGRARDCARRAHEHGAGVCERERLSIAYQYHYEVTGDQSRATETLEAWKAAVPQEFQPANGLAVIHNFLGRFDRAVDEGQDALARNPSHGYPYSNLAHAYRGLGDFDSARRTAEQAVALGIETLPTRRLLYQLALLCGDERSAAKQIDWARDRPREFDIVGARAQAVAWSGRRREARELYQRAARMAEARHLADVGTSHLAWSLSMEWAYGYTDTALDLARSVLRREPSYDSRLRAAFILGIAGHGDEAEAIAGAMAREHPSHTMINVVLTPIVRAGIELGRRQPARAIDALAPVAPYELGFIAALTPVYLRAQAYLMLGAAPQAAREFQRLLDRRGSDPFSPLHAVSRLGLARALAQSGQRDGSLAAYQQFLKAWKDADVDVPVLLAAREECARLAGEVSSRPRRAGATAMAGAPMWNRSAGLKAKGPAFGRAL